MLQISKRSIFYMLLSAFFFTAMNSAARYVIHLPTFELVFFRSIGSVVCCVIVLKSQNISLWGTHKRLLVLRALAGLVSLILFYKALVHLPLGTAVSLRYLSPIFAAAFGIYLLKEKVRPIQWLYFFIAFTGVAILKGFDPRLTAIGIFYIFLCAIVSGLSYIAIRKIGKREHPVVVVFYFLFVSSIVGGVISIFHWEDPVGTEWFALIGMGIVGFFAQFFMTKAMQIEVANKIVPFKYAEAVLTIAVGWLIFNESQSIISLFAIMMIIAALLANVVTRKAVS